MPHATLSEYQTKKLYYAFMNLPFKVYYLIRNADHIDTNLSDHEKKYVIKVDQGIKGRGKKGLVKIGLNLKEMTEWVMSLNDFQNFIIEEMMDIQSEHYFCILNKKVDNEWKNMVLYSEKGGVDIGMLEEGSDLSLKTSYIQGDAELTIDLEGESATLSSLYQFYRKYHFTYMECNPIAKVNRNGKTIFLPIDFAVKYDDTSLYLWGDELETLPATVTQGQITDEERNIIELDSLTGGSLKFKLLSPNGSIWTLVAGGGASVAYMDAILKRGYVKQLANYGEYSGNPPDDLVYRYAKNIFSLMNRSTATEPFTLFICGGIANFTMVDKTFSGIIRAIEEMQDVLKSKQTHIVVRRGGPKYEIALKNMSDVCAKLDIRCTTYPISAELTFPVEDVLPLLDHSALARSDLELDRALVPIDLKLESALARIDHSPECLQDFSKFFIYGNQVGVLQNILDYDYLCGRSFDKRTARAIIDFSKEENTNITMFYGKFEYLFPVYSNLNDALHDFPDTEGVLNFASFRSADKVSIDLLSSTLKWMFIIAEGIPEQFTQNLHHFARKNNKVIFGPATVGGFMNQVRLGNAGGMIDNIVGSSLCVPGGTVGIVTRSGGLLNELCHVTATVGHIVHSAVSIGGDRCPLTTFEDVVMRYQSIPEIDTIVLLGEVGGDDEIVIANLVHHGIVTKRVIGLCLGESSAYLEKNISFGHAGAFISSVADTSIYKNRYMEKCGIIVPKTFNDFGNAINPSKTARSSIALSGLADLKNRKKRQFISSISNENGDELMYNHKPISTIDLNIGNIISNLWFKKELPSYAQKYIEMILCICADHGAAVSGAQNTIISTRAGKDMVSSLCSGLLTIGPKFGGAINQAAKDFKTGFDRKMTPQEFVQYMKDRNCVISGIGHKIKTKDNPDKRVTILHDYVKKHFKSTKMTDFALSVQEVTLKKRNTLILNVDGFIAVSFIDMMLSSEVFTQSEIDQIIRSDILNGLFILARTIGFIGHHIDQKRLKQDLYRCPIENINYL